MDETEVTPTDAKGRLVGFTAAELVLILATLRWHAAGEPGADSNNLPVIEQVGLAGREADAIEAQLPGDWTVEDADGFIPNEVYYVYLPYGEDVLMTRWLYMILTNIYDAEPEGEL